MNKALKQDLLTLSPSSYRIALQILLQRLINKGPISSSFSVLRWSIAWELGGVVVARSAWGCGTTRVAVMNNFGF